MCVESSRLNASVECRGGLSGDAHAKMLQTRIDSFVSRRRNAVRAAAPRDVAVEPVDFETIAAQHVVRHGCAHLARRIGVEEGKPLLDEAVFQGYALGLSYTERLLHDLAQEAAGIGILENAA